MNDRQGQQQEPTMEEILASIRRIISDDEKTPEEDKTEPAPAPARDARKASSVEKQSEEAPVEVDAALPEEDAVPEEAAPDDPGGDEPPPSDIADEDDVLELTEMVNEDGSVVSLKDDNEDDDGKEEQEAPAPAAARSLDSRLLSESAASASTSAFASLAGTVAAKRGTPIGGGGRTLEEMVKEMLQPMLRQWLDDNLPSLVERLVEKEIARLARQAEDARADDQD